MTVVIHVLQCSHVPNLPLAVLPHDWRGVQTDQNRTHTHTQEIRGSIIALWPQLENRLLRVQRSRGVLNSLIHFFQGWYYIGNRYLLTPHNMLSSSPQTRVSTVARGRWYFIGEGEPPPGWSTKDILLPPTNYINLKPSCTTSYQSYNRHCPTSSLTHSPDKQIPGQLTD